MSAGYYGKREKLYLDDLHWGLITASHILHNHGIFDAYGHISVRNPDNSATFLMSRSIPPALMQSVEDIVEYKIEDAEPVEKDAPKGYAERCIHSEIYKKFPGVNAVAHSHAADVLPYTVNAVPLRAGIHMAGFLGSEVPVWDIAPSYSSKEKHDLLVCTPTLGHSFAASFKPSTSTGFLYSKMRAALPTQIGGTTPNDPAQLEPDHPVVLMRGHGFTTCADSLEGVVYQSIYTAEAAKVQTTALLTNNAHFGAVVEGKVNVEGGGKIQSGKVKGEGSLKFLSDREVGDAWAFNRDTMGRPWALWCREVEVNPLYRNEVVREEEK